MSARVSSIFVCLSLTLACNRDSSDEAPPEQPPAADDTGSTEAEAAGEPTLSAVEQIDRKLELYIVCLARSARRMSDSWSRYIEDIDPETGKPRRRKQAPFLFRIDNELTPCRKAAERGASWKPALPEIEAALERYVETAESFAETTRTLDAYYREEGFKKDQWQKGQELAPKFASEHEAWQRARDELQALVAAKKDEVDLQLLEQIERTEGKQLRYLTQAMLIEAKNFTRCTLKSQGDGSTCARAPKTFKTAYEAFRRRIESSPEQVKQVFWMRPFAESAAQFRQEVSRVETARKRKLDEARSRLQEAYMDLTRSAANLRFDFPTSGTAAGASSKARKNK